MYTMNHGKIRVHARPRPYVFIAVYLPLSHANVYPRGRDLNAQRYNNIRPN